MNADQMRQVLDELSMAFPKSKPLDNLDFAVKLWMEQFSSIDPEDMAHAVEAYIDEGEWFPTIKGFRKVLQRVSRQRVPEENCKCDGCGYYEVGAGRKRGWIPCPACLPGSHERWAGGHWAPGHHCEECNKVRRSDGPSQIIEEQSLVPRSAGRVLTAPERAERLATVQQVMSEMTGVRGLEGTARDRRLSPADKRRHWEERFNQIIAGDPIGRTVESEALTLEFLEPHHPAEIHGHEVL